MRVSLSPVNCAIKYFIQVRLLTHIAMLMSLAIMNATIVDKDLNTQLIYQIMYICE